MKYKNNVLDRIVQTETVVNRLKIQVNRNMSLEEINNSMDMLKESLDGIREMVSIEGDDFEQQFRPQ